MTDAGAPLFALVGSADGKIRSYAVDPTTGTWSLKRENSAGTNPSFLAFDPTRRRVVSTDETSTGLVRSFAFDPNTGAVTAIDQKEAGGAGTTHLSLDPRGALVFAANYTGGTVSVMPIAADGKLGGAIDTKRSGDKSHWAGMNPSGTHVFVPTLGLDAIHQYTLGTDNKLIDNGTVATPAGSGPRHLAFHPSERWAYVMNELGVSVTTLDFDKGTGKLSVKATVSALPAGQSAAGVSGAEIFAHPNGKVVYASTRSFNTIAVFDVNADGTLTLRANVPTGGDRPRSFALDPDATLLYAANQDQQAIVGFKIDATTGGLTTIGKVVDVPSPAFVGLAKIP